MAETAREWTCRFCRGRGVDPWLVTHDCPGSKSPREVPLPHGPMTEADVEKFAFAVRRANGAGAGGVHIRRDVARRILDHLRESTAFTLQQRPSDG